MADSFTPHIPGYLEANQAYQDGYAAGYQRDIGVPSGLDSKLTKIYLEGQRRGFHNSVQDKKGYKQTMLFGVPQEHTCEEPVWGSMREVGESHATFPVKLANCVVCKGAGDLLSKLGSKTCGRCGGTGVIDAGTL